MSEQMLEFMSEFKLECKSEHMLEIILEFRFEFRLEFAAAASSVPAAPPPPYPCSLKNRATCETAGSLSTTAATPCETQSNSCHRHRCRNLATSTAPAERLICDRLRRDPELGRDALYGGLLPDQEETQDSP